MKRYELYYTIYKKLKAVAAVYILKGLERVT